MSRKSKDWNWTLDGEKEGHTYSYPSAQLSVLMDIRDELKRLNNVLQCPNFIAVPSKLDRIIRNTTRRRKRAVVKPKLRVVR